MKKLIVLDYESEEIWVYNYDPQVYEEPEEFRDEYGDYVITDNCHFMIVDQLNLKIY